MIILVTGFDPFGKDTVNPSWEAVSRLPDEINGNRVIKMQLPTVIGRCVDLVAEAIERYHPDYVISVGQAAGRRGITVEKIAVNFNDFRIADNGGNQIRNQLIEDDGPAGYYTALPAEKIVEKITAEGLQASLSYHAGTFVCNHLMYGVRHYCQKNGLAVKSGFIHVPCIREQITDDRVPYMELKDIIRALTVALTAVSEEEEK